MRKALYLAIALTLLVPGFWPFASVSAQTAPLPGVNYIISDDDFTDTSMSAERIQAFLDGQTGILKNYKATVNGQSLTTAQLIYAASQANGISPKVLLTIIQKESSMISRSSFSQPSGCVDAKTKWPCSGSPEYYAEWLGFAGWCENTSKCYYGSPYLDQFRGFANQISLIASILHGYLWGNRGIYHVYTAADAPDPQSIGKMRGYTTSGFGPGIPDTVSDCMKTVNHVCVAWQTYAITPANAAASALYTYTPHVASANSFRRIWDQYNFSAHRIYPDGSLIRASGKSTVYLIDQGVKRPFASAAAFVSRYSFSKVINVSPDQLFLYDDGAPIKFANYSLLQPPGPGVYLLVDTKIRPIASGAAFKAAGFSRDEVVKVKLADIAPYAVGDKITTDNIYPSGQLLQNKKTGGIYFVQEGVRHLIPTKDIYKNQFGLRKPIPTAGTIIDAYTKGDWVPFRDGEIITSKKGGTAYFVSHGQRLPITSWAAAVAYHFDKIWGHIIKTDDASINSMPLGPALDVDGQVQIASQP